MLKADILIEKDRKRTKLAKHQVIIGHLLLRPPTKLRLEQEINWLAPIILMSNKIIWNFLRIRQDFAAL